MALRSRHRLPFVLGVVLFAAALLVTVDALALPLPGGRISHAQVEDPDGKTLDLASLRGWPTLVLYEDKNTAQENEELRDQLAAMAEHNPRSRSLAVVPVVDLAAYDFWPARGFARGAVKDESRKSGVHIYCDWKGGFRQAMSLRRGTSSTVVIGRDGTVLFAREGKLSPSDRAALINLLVAQLGG